MISRNYVLARRDGAALRDAGSACTTDASRLPRRLVRSIAHLKARRRDRRAPTPRDRWLLGVGLAALPAIFAIDVLTGPWSVNILYVAAILIVAVAGGLRWSIPVAAGSAAAIALSASWGEPDGVDACRIAVDLANAAATFVLVAYLPARLREALERSDVERETDSLTGVANRVGFERVLNEVVALHRRYARPFSIVFLDVDDFKGVNDNPALGHEVGDAVLRAIGATLLDTLRESDVPGRRGGDEFVAVLPETDAPSGLIAVVKLKAELDRRMVAAGWGVTFSIGIASIELHQLDPASLEGINLFDVADKVQYAAKRGGKNRIEQRVIGSVAALRAAAAGRALSATAVGPSLAAAASPSLAAAAAGPSLSACAAGQPRSAAPRGPSLAASAAGERAAS